MLERARLERLIVGSVAGALPAAKSLFYRLFRAREVTPRPADPRITAFSALIANDGACTPPPIDPERDVALLQYTGGTTGTPKGAMLTHQALTANARQIAAVDPHRGDDDRIVGVLPLFHIFANAARAQPHRCAGGEIVMLPRFDAGQVLAARRAHQGDRAARRADDVPGAARSSRRRQGRSLVAARLHLGRRAAAAELKERFEAATGARLVEGYGLTEVRHRLDQPL